jgi:fission process protein 1
MCEPLLLFLILFVDGHALSRALPAFTIHTIVSRAKKVFDASKSLPPRVKMWGPTLTGLSAVPALPYLFDHPVEVATEQLGDWAREWLADVIGSND